MTTYGLKTSQIAKPPFTKPPFVNSRFMRVELGAANGLWSETRATPQIRFSLPRDSLLMPFAEHPGMVTSSARLSCFRCILKFEKARRGTATLWPPWQSSALGSRKTARRVPARRRFPPFPAPPCMGGLLSWQFTILAKNG